MTAAPADHVETICVLMHDAYEAAATGAGWETNPASRKPWANVPEARTRRPCAPRSVRSCLRPIPAVHAALRGALARHGATQVEAQ